MTLAFRKLTCWSEREKECGRWIMIRDLSTQFLESRHYRFGGIRMNFVNDMAFVIALEGKSKVGQAKLGSKLMKQHK